MKDRVLIKIRLLSGLKQFANMLIKDDKEREALIDGLENLSESQLMKLKSIILQNPKIMEVIARQAFQKKIILDKKDKQAWMELLQAEEKSLGQEFLKIMDEEVKNADQQALDELRKTL